MAKHLLVILLLVFWLAVVSVCFLLRIVVSGLHPFALVSMDPAIAAAVAAAATALGVTHKESEAFKSEQFEKFEELRREANIWRAVLLVACNSTDRDDWAEVGFQSLLDLQHAGHCMRRLEQHRGEQVAPRRKKQTKQTRQCRRCHVNALVCTSVLSCLRCVFFFLFVLVVQLKFEARVSQD